MSLEKLREWVGRTQAMEDFAAPFPVRALTATLDESDPDPRFGDVLPPLWHWLYFLEIARQSGIGPDGHAERGEFLPNLPLPRRMWAGSKLEFRSPIKVGDRLQRHSEILSVQGKSGSTGQLVFVTVRHTHRGAQGGEVYALAGAFAVRAVVAMLALPAMARAKGGHGFCFVFHGVRSAVLRVAPTVLFCCLF